MSSKPSGIRFSTVSSAPINSKANNSSKNTSVTKNPNSGKNFSQSMQHQQQQQQQQQQQHETQSDQLNNKKLQPSRSEYSMSGSDTDVSTSNENLSVEQRYVLRHTPRVEPQGQENLTETTSSGNESSGARFVSDHRFSSNTSSDSTRYASSNRSASETRAPIFNTQSQQQQQQQQQQQPQQSSANGSNSNNNNNNNGSVNIGSNSNRNSLKDNINSNRSSMDVSTCSYNTLIIHTDDSLYASMLSGNRSGGEHQHSQDANNKKDRPLSYDEQGMQEITEIPDDYLNQSHVLKHLAKEIKIPNNRRRTTSRESSIMKTDAKDPPKYEQWINEEQNEQIANKLKSKSQPDLTKLTENDRDAMETLIKENQLLKQQLQNCFLKVAKTQKLEEEVSNIYRVHEELKQTCERREKLERAARMHLQSDLQRVQELNCVMKDQVDILQSQLLAPSEHQLLIAQLFTQNKELGAAKERQEIELGAQRATLQEQRNHIGILDTALTNAQQNIRRLEEELRKKQMYIDRLNQLHGALQQSKQCERKNLLDYDSELAKEPNRSGSSTNSETKWQMADKSQMMRLESEQRQLEEHAMRQNAAKLSSIDKNHQEDRIIAEAKHDKLLYLEEVHSAQRKVNDLQTHLKVLESKLADKDAEIRLLQEKKICGSSFDSYNSYALSPLGYNSQASYNVSNNSFNTNANTSLLEQAYNHPSSTMTGGYAPNQNYTSQTSPYKPNLVNLQAMNSNGGVSGAGGSIGSGGGNYSANSSNYSNNYESPNYTQNTSSYHTSFENITRKSIDDHMKKHIDEQLLTKVSQLSLEDVTKLLAQKQREFNSTNNIILNQIQTSKEIASSCRDISTDKEEFY